MDAGPRTRELTVSEALAQRRSVRGFLPDPVARSTVEAILTDARRAPSGANLQPGRFIALTGTPLAALSGALAEAIAEGRPQVAEYSYFPKHMPPELKARQRAAGYALYEALGIERRDLDGRRRQFDRNYRFFDAPVGVIVTIDRGMGKGCFMDLGMAIMALLASAEARGLATCGLGAIAHHGDVVHEALGLPEGELVVCGIALGRADPAHPANAVRTAREPLEVFTELRGF
ncbi:nitroreductase [Vannielia litorea]|uniref:Nitroreductase n=1 Tax=Vannielia litorea TaxID=1217970 RepID=A0A1N6GC55_9RHOB|nr:nitroreductase [Vannielia litorea]SIO05103.1 Nitroreductase [Vannielia litorea]